MLRNSLIFSFCVLAICSNLEAASRITVTGLKTFNGARLIAVASNGKSSSASISGGKAKITPPASKVHLYVVKDGEVRATFAAEKVSSRTVSANSSKVATVFKKVSKIVAGRPRRGVILAQGLDAHSYRKTVDTGSVTSVSKVREGVAGHGLGSRTTTSSVQNTQVSTILASNGDADGDGLHNVVDVDNNGDNIPDNYDTISNDMNSLSTTIPRFVVFSNFKLPIDQSLNLHTTGLDTSRIDTALQAAQTLAIGVAGDPSNSNLSVELDCTGLSYCSSGGTGLNLGVNPAEAFPGSPGSTYDPDGDGFGTITRGSSGDFQLQTVATLSDIAAGDVLSEIVTDASSGTSTKGAALLNFVFVSNPAAKTITTSLATNTVDYSVTPILGSSLNCILVDASAAVSITVEGYRPQRPGVSSAGEGTWVDIGKSTIVIDIPNGPVNTPQGNGGTGPGNCRSNSYSTTDANLQVNSNGLQDLKSDQDADSTNTYSFTVNVTDCLDNASGGAISWSSGQYLYLDLQFKSNYNDNSAQKFCLQRQ